MSESKRRISQYAWTITKTIANTANAIIIIGIAAFASWISWSSSEQEDNNKHEIIKLNARIDSLAAREYSILIADTIIK